MLLPMKASQTAQGVVGNEYDGTEIPSNNLWVGNLSPDVTDTELMEILAQYGALDSVTSYSSRSYAFVYFKRVQDAKAAKDALQGTVLRGNSLKIEFARPAKPGRSLWIGGISPGVAKEELEHQFLSFGKIEDFRLIRDRSTAFVDYFSVEDATQAMKNMNGKRIGGDQIRVDFLRSQSVRREQWVDSRETQFLGRNGPASDILAGQKRPQQYSQTLMGRKGDNQPSKILWIGYPPSVQIDEQMLHNAMILFGEIEKIKNYPSRHYAFVEFRSVDEAKRAKEGLQGRLFNNPRITIMFSNSDLAPGNDYPILYPGNKGQRSELFLNKPPFSHLPVDSLGHNHAPEQGAGVLGPNTLIRTFSPQSSFDPILSGPELHDTVPGHRFQDGKIGTNWRRPSPPPGIVPSPVPGVVPPSRSAISGPWDVLDTNQFHRDSKRLRIDGAMSVEDHGGLLMEYGRVSPASTRVVGRVPSPGLPENDFLWRGVIAKGGTPVCHARCIPIGKGIRTNLPVVINCSARTGLDLLTKHYADAIGFEIVFFLPDSEDDFASYTEFLRYLGAKDRAGVAKFDDGTTLFLVPPSEFLTNVLKVPGPERIYGVVLKFPPAPSTSSVQRSPQLPYSERRQFPPHQGDYSLIPSKEEVALPEYNRGAHDDSKLLPKPFYQPVTVTPAMQSVPQEYVSSNKPSSQAGITLTPELIATLSSILPATAQASGLEGAKAALSTPDCRPGSISTSDVNQSQLRRHDQHISNYASHSLQRLGSTHNPQVSPYHPYAPLSNTPGHPPQVLDGSTQTQDSTNSLHQGVVSSGPMTSHMVPSQSGQVSVSTLVSQQYQTGGVQEGYGVVQGTDSTAFYNVNVSPHKNGASSNVVHGAIHSQPQDVMAFAADNQIQAFQSAAGNGNADNETDKNQRYQSTLQFAANLLLQIQQKQKAQGGQGPGN